MPKSADAIVVGLATINGGETAAVGVGADLDKKYESAYGRGVMAMATALGASASADSVTVLPALEGSRLVVVGLEDADVTPERLRRATGNALRSIAAMEGADGWEVAVSRSPIQNSSRPPPRARCSAPTASRRSPERRRPRRSPT